MKRKMVAYLLLIFVAANFTIYVTFRHSIHSNAIVSLTNGLLLGIQTDVWNRNPPKTGSVRLHQKQIKRAAVNNDDYSDKGNKGHKLAALSEASTVDVITNYDDEVETITSPGTSNELRSQTGINEMSTSYNVTQSTSGRDINSSTRAALTTSPSQSPDIKQYFTYIFFGSACMISLLSVTVIYLCVRNCQKDRKLRSLEGTNDNTEEDPWITEMTERNMDLPAPVLEKKNEVLPFHNSLPTLITTSQDELRYTIAGLKKPTPLQTFTPGPETFRRQIPQSGMRKFIKTNGKAHLRNRAVANDIKLKKIVLTAESEGWADNVAYEAFKTANKKVISDLETSCMG